MIPHNTDDPQILLKQQFYMHSFLDFSFPPPPPSSAAQTPKSSFRKTFSSVFYVASKYDPPGELVTVFPDWKSSYETWQNVLSPTRQLVHWAQQCQLWQAAVAFQGFRQESFLAFRDTWRVEFGMVCMQNRAFTLVLKSGSVHPTLLPSHDPLPSHNPQTRVC